MSDGLSGGKCDVRIPGVYDRVRGWSGLFERRRQCSARPGMKAKQLRQGGHTHTHTLAHGETGGGRDGRRARERSIVADRQAQIDASRDTLHTRGRRKTYRTASLLLNKGVAWRKR